MAKVSPDHKNIYNLCSHQDTLWVAKPAKYVVLTSQSYNHAGVPRKIIVLRFSTLAIKWRQVFTDHALRDCMGNGGFSCESLLLFFFLNIT